MRCVLPSCSQLAITASPVIRMHHLPPRSSSYNTSHLCFPYGALLYIFLQVDKHDTRTPNKGLDPQAIKPLNKIVTQ